MQGLSRFITTFPSRHSTTPFQRFIQQQNKPFFQFATFSSRRHLCTASSVTKVQDIRQFAPRFEKQLNQFLQETQHISAKDELELRSLREHQRFSEFIQQEIRGLIKLQPISAIVLYCIQPLLERCNIKYVALILELADLMPNYLLEIILTIQKSKPDISEDTLCQLVKGGCANYSSLEYTQFFVGWRNKSEKLTQNESEKIPEAYKWGQRLGKCVPVISVIFMKPVILRMLLSHWKQTTTWAQLHELQTKRFEGCLPPEKLLPPPPGKGDTEVLDTEDCAALVAGLFNTWYWGYHAEQRSQLFREINSAVSSLCETEFPKWYTKHTQNMLLGDLVGATIIGTRVGPSQIDGLLVCGINKQTWTDVMLQNLIERIEARCQDYSIFKRLFRRISFKVNKKTLPPPPLY